MAKKKDEAAPVEKAPVKKKGTYQDRVRAEKVDLDVKIKALAKFMEESTFVNLQPEDRAILTDQLGYMKRYTAMLDKRISRFTDKK